MKRIIATSVIAIVIASFATVAVAGDHRGKGKHKHMRGDRIMKVFGQLDLSPEQQAAIEKIRAKAHADTMAVLTPEQREKLAEMKAARAERRKDGKGERSGKKGRGKNKRAGKKGHSRGTSVDPAAGSNHGFQTRS